MDSEAGGIALQGLTPEVLWSIMSTQRQRDRKVNDLRT